MQPDASIRGQVLDEQNEPVRNATAQLFRMDEVDGLRRAVSVTNAGTNDQGYYHFSHLGPGTYYVALSARPWYAQYSPQGGSAAQAAARRRHSRSGAAGERRNSTLLIR